MKCTLFIPAHNEAEVITDTITFLRDAFRAETDIDWYITVVDNASDDNTATLVRAFNDARIDVHTIKEKGKGIALRTGFSSVTVLDDDHYLGFTDSDLSVPPEEIIAGFRKLSRKESDVIIGSRFHPQSKMPEREWWRIGSSKIYNILAKVIVGITISDSQCPLKVMNEKGVHILCSTEERTWFMDLEFLALCAREGVRVEEMPVTWNEHRYPFRKSKLSMTRDGIHALVAMFRIRQRLKQQLAKDAIWRKLNNMKWIIVGLGNPGGEYAKTRHNAGRIALEVFRKKYDLPDWEYKKTYDALVSRGTVAGRDVLLLEPETYMNDSGKSLATLIKSKDDATQLVVIHDDADLPIGAWRSARDRGAGGQKGVESIITTIKTKDFYRFRVGVAPVTTPETPRRKAGDFVLEKFSVEELSTIKSRSIGIAERIVFLITEGHQKFKDSVKKIKPIDP